MSELSKQALQVENTTSFPNNTTGYITPTLLRTYNSNTIDSTVNQTVYTSNSGSWNISISNLNAFTASQQPTFNSLNAFTASQLVINSGVNSFTQSANSSITQLNVQSASFYAYTASINQIQSNGVLLGTSTRFNLVGSTTFFSASLVQNVGGPIATLTFTSDDGKVNTSSFNPFTASVNTFTASANVSITNINSTTASLNTSVSNLNTYTASQTTFNNSITASVGELLALSSSLSGGYATQGELDASSSTLQANIDTKLNTSSFNAYTSSQGGLNTFSSSINTYTASNDTKWTTIGLLTGSYATTGSNVFTGSQTITGSVYGNVVSMSITSQTASMNLSLGNFFTLTLVSGSTTQLAASNIKAGQTINLLLNQPSVGTGSLSYNSTFKFPAGANYIATTITGSKDIITLVTFDTTNIYAASINNLG